MTGPGFLGRRHPPEAKSLLRPGPMLTMAGAGFTSGAEVRIILLRQRGNVPIGHKGAFSRGAALMPGKWRVAELVTLELRRCGWRRCGNASGPSESPVDDDLAPDPTAFQTDCVPPPTAAEYLPSRYWIFRIAWAHEHDYATVNSFLFVIVKLIG
jgi:hypothetical protein